MRVSCPTCGTVVSPDDLPTDHAPLACRTCHSAMAVDPFGSPAVGTLSPPAAVRRKRKRAPRPNRFSVKADRSQLRIRYRWVWSRFTGPALMCLAWNSFVVGWYWAATRPPMERGAWLGVVFCLPHAAIGLLLVYATLAGFLNRTVIRATAESVTVWNGPVPWWGNRRVPVADLDRLDCREDPTEAGRGRTYAYGVHAQTKGAGTVDLVTDLDHAQALFVLQELRRWLNIEGTGVGPKPVAGG